MKLKLDSTAKRRNLMATTVLAGVAALGAPAAVAIVTALAPTAALAQDYTSGTFVGHVTDSSGAPVSGAAVTVRSAGTGVTQNTVTDSAGEFRAPLIPTGSYSVTIRKAGFTDISQTGLSVRIGGESNYGFTLTTPSDLSEVVVVAKRPQPQLDFSQTTKGIAIDVEQLQKQVPIARNVTAVVLLAPGAVNATFNAPAFTSTQGEAVPSIGGSSAGENAFFINGLNITNFDTYIGAATVPFDFYKTIEVKTGGYSAEFGRATGGVINAVTKSGTNDFYFAIHGNYTPDFTRSNVPNVYSALNAATKNDVAQTSFEFGGPIWRDHLFFYGLYQLNSQVAQGVTGTSQDVFRNASTTASLVGTTTSARAGTLTKSRNKSPFYGAKVDFYLTPRQHFEFTDFNTTNTQTNRTFNYVLPNPNFASQNSTNVLTPTATNRTTTSLINGGDALGYATNELVSNHTKVGGNNFVAKYTGTFTDWFTISGAYGENNDGAQTRPNVAGNTAYAADARANGTAVRLSPFTSGVALTNIDTTFRQFYRVDADVYVNFIGRHHFRAGYDNEDTTLSHQQVYNGGGTYTYMRALTPSAANPAISTLGLATNQDYVQVLTYNLGGGGAGVYGTNQAFYLQDSWDLTRRLNLQIGVRDDIFRLKNLIGETAVDLSDNWAPRIAVSYDPFGNSTDKLFASYGRYFVPPASNLSFRGKDLYVFGYFLPPAGLSFDPYINPTTFNPTALGAPITNTTFASANGSNQICPAGVPGAGTRSCQINGDGSQEPGATKSAANLKASYEDEFIIGYQKKFNNLWTASATVTYRNLGRTSEDIDNLDVGIFNYCKRNASHVGCNLSQQAITDVINAKPDYALINPGSTAIVTVRTDAIDGNTGLKSILAGQTFELTADDLGFPKPKREYYALELAFDRAFDGKWSLAGNYTLSKSVGNVEGTVKTDAGNGQVDAGSTQDFDYPGLEDNAYGLLPNHRAHQFKLYGSYMLPYNVLVGFNAVVQSPNKYGCIGYYPAPGSVGASGGAGGVDINAAAYRAASHYCYNPALGYSQASVRGSAFDGDWYYQMDMSARYTVPKFSKYMIGDLVLRMDVFNIFNAQQVVRYNQFGDSAASTRSVTYQLPLNYQAPRSVRFGFDLVF